MLGHLKIQVNKIRLLRTSNKQHAAVAIITERTSE